MLIDLAKHWQQLWMSETGFIPKIILNFYRESHHKTFKHSASVLDSSMLAMIGKVHKMSNGESCLTLLIIHWLQPSFWWTVWFLFNVHWRFPGGSNKIKPWKHRYCNKLVRWTSSCKEIWSKWILLCEWHSNSYTGTLEVSVFNELSNFDCTTMNFWLGTILAFFTLT